MTSTARTPEAARIAVFAKAPVPGAVKTRLAATLGDEGAASLHAQLVRRALATAVEAGTRPAPRGAPWGPVPREAPWGHVELWCAPDESHAFFEECAREFGVPLKRQRGADLGERMQHAAGEAHAQGSPIVIIGADCPALTASHLRLAAHALRVNDAVFVPAEDGGYVLVALSKPVEGLFEGVTWGGDQVMAQTRARLSAAAARWLELPALWDVDRPSDHARLEREGLLSEGLS